MQFVSDFNLPLSAGNRLLALLKLSQSFPNVLIPMDHRRMVERICREYGRSTTMVEHSLSLKNIHPCLADIPDLTFQ